MMVGSGKRGYHNIIGKDPKVHSDSARGRKQPQRVPQFITREPKRILKKIIIDLKTFDKIIKAERQKERLENQGYKLIDTKQIGIDKFENTYFPKISGWEDLSEIFSDGSESFEWKSKYKKISIYDNAQFGSGWIVAVTSLKKGEPPQLMSDTNNTKENAFKKAIIYMQNNR